MGLNIGIIGIGFIGGSLIKSLSKSKKVSSILAYDTNKSSLENAFNDGFITDYTISVNEKFSNCDIIFICTPVSYILHYAKILKDIVKNDCIITDIGSTKKTIIQGVENLEIEFVGGHPMVGSEKNGYNTSKNFLFENSFYIITKTKKNKDISIEKLKEIILKDTNLKFNIELLENLDDENQTMKMLAAGGFKDITRIASSDPIVWSNICNENKDNIIKILQLFVNMINNFITNINDNEKIFNFFESSKLYRDSFINKKINGNSIPELNINIKDENGAIAKVTTLLSNYNIGIKNIEVINNRENNYGALKIIVTNYEELDNAYNILMQNGYDVVSISS